MLAGRADEIPARALMRLEPEALAASARALADGLAGVPGATVDVAEGRSQPGSGSAPGVYLPTTVVRLALEGFTAEGLASALRRGEPPVFCRIHEDTVLLDPRTLLEGDLEALVESVRALR